MSGRPNHTTSWQPEDRIVSEPERARITGYCRGHWWRLEQQDPNVPKRIKLGPRKVGWLQSELLDWLQRRAAARDASASSPPPVPANTDTTPDVPPPAPPRRRPSAHSRSDAPVPPAPVQASARDGDGR